MPNSSATATNVVALRRPQARSVAWWRPEVIAWIHACLRSSGREFPTDDQPGRFLRLREVQAMTGLSRSSLYRKIAIGSFPPPVRLDGGGE